ncbi:MAG: putative membrane protein [Crocinitomicaceae bacterium]|jgi:putative membrane protein
MNMVLSNPRNVRKAKKLIYAVSVIVPIAVAALFKVRIEDVDFSFLPPIYATINGITAILLILALVAIKKKNMKLHRMFIRTCLLLSILFLLSYIAYHITSDETLYQGAYGALYYPLLIAHIVLSVLVIPIVLLTYLWAWMENYEKHKKWTRFAWPIWMFVAISGVIVYLMISPYYK